MKSGVFPCIPKFPGWGVDNELLLVTQFVAKCMNDHP